VPESALPVELPDMPDYAPVQLDPDDADSEPRRRWPRQPTG